MNRLWISFASLIALPLCAETIGNVEFQFPSSHYEWRLLTNDELFKAALASIEEEVEEEADLDMKFKLFTHREGDALEMLAALSGSEDDEIDAFDPAVDGSMLEFLQKSVNEVYSAFQLPHHKLLLLSAEKMEDGYFFAWEFNDGQQDLLHGYLRKIRTPDGLAILSYATTAPHSEGNRQLWTETLMQANR